MGTYKPNARFVGVIGVVALAALSPLATAASPERPVVADGSFAATLRTYLVAAGIEPSPEAWSHLEALGAVIDEALADLTPTRTQGNGPMKIIPPFGVEACNGAGSCGGSYRGPDERQDHRQYYYVMNGAYSSASSCNNNTVILNTWVGDGNTVCYSYSHNTACVSGNCTNLDEATAPPSLASGNVPAGLPDPFEYVGQADDFLIAVRSPPVPEDGRVRIHHIV